MMGFTFGQPLWLWALLLLPVCAALYLWNSKRRREILGKVVSPRLREQLVANVSHTKRRVRFGLFLLALGLVIVTLAQPRRGFVFEEATMKGRDIIIAIDTSRSMLANDLQPNRLTRAKLAAQDLLNQLGGDRVGLVAFAGSSFLQAPLTADYSAVTNALNELDTDIIPRGGTNMAGAINTAIEAFGKGESSSRALIVFTDGEELDQNAMATAAKLEGQVKIFTVGVGSEAGSVIPIPGPGGGTDFVRDAQGQIVKSKLDEGLLSRLAEASGGFYLRLQNGPADMQRIISQGLSGLQEQTIDERTSRRPIERFQWPLAAGMFLLVAAMFITDRKRRLRTATALALLLFAIRPAQALDSVEQYKAGKYDQSYQGFQRHMKLKPNSKKLEYGLGAAAYKLGKFDEALTSFSQALTTEDPELRAKAEYNIGNTLFQRGNQRKESEDKIKEWKESLAHYDETLKLQPENKDAQYNRDLVAKLIEQEKQKQEEKKQEDQKKEDQKKEDDQKKDQDKKDDQKKDQSKGGDQDKKDQPPEDGDKGEDKKDGKSGQDEKKDDPQKDGKGDKDKPDPKDGSKGDEKKPDDSSGEGDQKGDEKKSESGEPGEGDKEKPSQGQPKPGESPAPVPDQPDRDREGDLQAQEGEKGEPPEQSQAAQAQAAAEAAEAEGKMSERQAAALLRSLQGEEVSVPLNQPPLSGRVTKDW